MRHLTLRNINLGPTRAALAALFACVAMAHLSAHAVGPTVSPDQLSRDSTQNQNRAPSQYVPLPPPVPCNASTASWTQGSYSCSAPYPGGADGSQTSVSTAPGTTVGTATVTCTNGTAAASGTCAAAANCLTGPQTWTVNGNQCTASPATTASGATVAANDTTGPQVGGATFQCNNGTFVVQPGATCGTQCSSQSKTWTSGASSCTATLPLTNDGGTAPVSDATGPDIGSATYSCSNGVWNLQAGSSCVTQCPSQAQAWAGGSASCTATPAATNSGQYAALTDSVGPDTGNATYLCNAGSWQLQAGSSCATTSASCTAGTVSWTSGAYTCQGSYGGGAHGTSAGVTDSTGPYVGSGTTTCNNGTPQTTGSCGAQCPSGQSFTWTVSSKQCAGSTSTAGSPGNTRAVAASGTNAGTASFLCNTDGTWSTTAQAGATCAASGPGDGGAPCSIPANTAWNSAGGTCQLNDDISWPSGTQLQVVDEIGYYRGSATGTCSNGTYNVINTSCSPAYGGSPPCAGTTVSWTVGSNTCVGPLPAGDTSTNYSAADSNTGADGGTTGATGSKPYTCNGSSWVAAAGTTVCNGAPPCPQQTAYWGGNCSATLFAAPAGSNVNATNTAAGYNGGASYACSASTGQWSGPTNPTCTATVVGCPAVTMEWQNGALCSSSGPNACCSGTFPSASSGGGSSASDGTEPTTGSASSTCYNGTRTYTSASCTIKCPAIAAYTYQESNGAGCNVGADNWNQAMNTPTPIGGYATMYFYGSSTSVTYQCVDPPSGTNYGYKYYSTNACN